MSSIRVALVSLVFLVLLTPQIHAQPNTDQPRRSNDDRLLDNLFRVPRDAKLTDEQQAKLQALRKDKGPDALARLADVQKQIGAIYTQEQRDARQKAFRAARDAGKNAREAQAAGNAAAKLTKEQQAEIEKLRRQQQKIQAAARRDVNAILGRTNRGGQGPRVKPTQANVKFGPHERNVLDFWQAESRVTKGSGLFDVVFETMTPDPFDLPEASDVSTAPSIVSIEIVYSRPW